MRNATDDGVALGSDAQDDGYRSVVSSVVGLIEHVQHSLQLIEQNMTGETTPGGQENAANVIVLDDVSPRYVRAAAALKACDANLGAALRVLLNSEKPARGASAYAEISPTYSASRI